MSSTDNNDTVTETLVTETTESTTTTASERSLGLVKWFTGGHGFITNFDTNEDVFVHHTQLNATVDCWKSLYPGEYVDFSVGPADGGKTQATDVTGVRRGPLRCETNALLRREREEYNDTRGGSRSEDEDFSDDSGGGHRSRRRGRDFRDRGRSRERGRDRDRSRGRNSRDRRRPRSRN